MSVWTGFNWTFWRTWARNPPAFLAALVMYSIGGLASLGLYQIVDGELTEFINRQTEKPVLTAFDDVQYKANANRDFVSALAGLLRLRSQLNQSEFETFAERMAIGDLKVSGVYVLRYSGTHATAERALLTGGISLPTDIDFERAPELRKLLQNAQSGEVVSSAIVPGRIIGRTSGNILIYATNLKPNIALVSMVHVNDLFAPAQTLMQTEGLIELSATVEQSDIPFLLLSKPIVVNRWFDMRQRGKDTLALPGMICTIEYTVVPRGNMLIILLIPFGVLLAGFVLTAVIITYIRQLRNRNRTVSDLSLSLRRVSDELGRKIAEEARIANALRESERKYRTIFENAGIGIVQVAPNGEWLGANRTAAILLGYTDTPELLTLQPDKMNKLFVDEDARKYWFEQINESSQRNYEVAMYTQDHHVIWVNMSGHPVRDVNDQLMYYECTFYDVTQRRQTEMALLSAKEQADFANRSKSEFLANMSHELRTPLNAIIGFSEIIKDQLFGQVGQPQYVEYAKDIYDSGQLLLSLINDILDMSKIEAGKRALSDAVLEVDKVVQACVRLVAARAKLQKQRLTTNIPKDIPMIKGEERAIKQIFTNLLTNAIKFTPEGGSITLTAVVDNLGRLRIMVEDTGIGIAPEDVSVALTPFGQIESALSRKTQGTGLGLPLTKALVELHDGTLDLESQLGVGTTVTITFPKERVLIRQA